MKDKFQILRDFANSNNKPDKTIYQFIKEVLDMNSAYAKENKQLKMINKEYERLNKENGRGFTITSVKQYNIDELVKCEDNWNKLKEYLHNQIPTDKTVLTKHIKIFEVLDKMQEIEQGSDSNE